MRVLPWVDSSLSWDAGQLGLHELCLVSVLGLATSGAGGGYWVRTHVALLSERHLDRAGLKVHQLHDHLMAGKTHR